MVYIIRVSCMRAEEGHKLVMDGAKALPDYGKCNVKRSTMFLYNGAFSIALTKGMDASSRLANKSTHGKVSCS